VFYEFACFRSKWSTVRTLCRYVYVYNNCKAHYARTFIHTYIHSHMKTVELCGIINRLYVVHVTCIHIATDDLLGLILVLTLGACMEMFML
jgi:hypothetical protein